MTKTKTLAFIILFSCLVVTGWAQNTSAQQMTREEQDAARLPCSKKDVQEIKKFNRRAGQQKHKADNLTKKVNKMDSLSEAYKMQDKMDEIEAFFRSPEYQAMRPVYSRCSATMPKI